VFSYLEAKRLLRCPIEFLNESLTIRSLSIDTRTLCPGDLFVALQGERSDGHEFLASAFEKGASGALLDIRRKDELLAHARNNKMKIKNLIFVQDAQASMALLATEYRKKLSVRVIGITGSVGKTTTKEFLYYLLRQKFSTLATTGNLNNHLGVPIMLSRLEASHDFCVMEMGASHLQEIRYLAGLAAPLGGILTPIGPAHLAGFGSLENVYEAKLELVDSLPPKGPLVVPDNDERLLHKLQQKKRRAVTVGFSDCAEYKITDVHAKDEEVFFRLCERGPFSFSGQAPFLALNAGLAIAMALSLGFSWEELPLQWKDVGFASGRFRETILSNGVRIIDDSYNANPVSFQNALSAFQLLPRTGKKIIVFADMLELGPEENRFHQELGQRIAVSAVDIALAFGKRTQISVEAIRSLGSGCDASHFESPEEILDVLKKVLRPGDRVLFKGSRSMHVEKILEGVRAFPLFL